VDHHSLVHLAGHHLHGLLQTLLLLMPLLQYLMMMLMLVMQMMKLILLAMIWIMALTSMPHRG
jgi:hypothetical protein